MKALKVQLDLLLTIDYEIAECSDKSFVVTNVHTEVQFFVQVTSTPRTCSCLFQGTFGLPCRHIMAVQRQRKQDIVSLSDCLPRRFRHSDREEQLFPGPIDRMQQLADVYEDPAEDVPQKAVTEKERYTQTHSTCRLMEQLLPELPTDRYVEAQALY